MIIRFLISSQTKCSNLSQLIGARINNRLITLVLPVDNYPEE